LVQAASSIETAVHQSIADPATRTHDLGGTLGTAAFAAAIVERLKTA
jgi:3-isopropylmalate dehydrogenase